MSINNLPSSDDREPLHQQLRLVLNKMTQEEQDILTMRYGLHDNQEHTLTEVMQHFSITRERLRQIEAKALRKLNYS